MRPLAILGRAMQAAGRALGGAAARIEGFGGAVTGPNYSGVFVTPARALCLTACYAAINVLSRDLASLPLSIHQKDPQGRRREAIDDPRRELVYFSPDGVRTAFRYRQAKLSHALTHGNGYSEIERLRDGRPAALHLLDPTTTRASRSRKTGLLWYEQDRGAAIPAEDVVHIAPMGFDGISGYSPIRLAMQAVALGLAAETFGAAFFGNGSTPKGIIKTPKRLSDTAAARLRDGWERIHAGPMNAARTAVLEEGAEWIQTTIPPEEAQFVETRKFQVIEIARLYGLPPHKIGDYSQAHMSNVENSNLDYLVTSLRAWCESTENEWDLKLFTREERAAGYYTAHDMTAFLRGDSAARAAYWQIMQQTGATTPNQIAAAEGFDPIGPAGDVHLIPLNFTTLEQAGEADTLAARVAQELVRMQTMEAPAKAG